MLRAVNEELNKNERATRDYQRYNQKDVKNPN